MFLLETARPAVVVISDVCSVRWDRRKTNAYTSCRGYSAKRRRMVDFGVV